MIGKRIEARYFEGKRYDMILMDILANEHKSIYVKPLLNNTE